VYLGSPDIEKGNAAVAKLNSKGIQNVKAVELDVTNADTILAAKAIIEKEQGKLDVLINNAGTNGGAPFGALEATSEQFLATFDINFFGAARVTQAFIELLKKSDEPRIVNVTSALGSLTLADDPDNVYYHFKMPVYQSSKAALNMYTIALAYELKDTAFKINAVDPGFTKTDFNGHRGTGTVEVAAQRIVKYAIIDKDGATGRFFSEELNPETGEIPW
jgi:NAD(P)-dependent dehydrogenase (short-subunit alcohol dehydrogenase family)